MKRIIATALVIAVFAIASIPILLSLPAKPVSWKPQAKGLQPAQVAKSSTAVKKVKIKILGDHNFKDTLENSKTIVVVDFYADWCGPCRGIAPAIQDLANKYDGKVLVVKVNTDFAPNTSRNEGIRSLPTVKVYAPGGKLLDTKIGGASRDPSTGQWIPYDVKVYEEFIKPHLPKPEKKDK